MSGDAGDGCGPRDGLAGEGGATVLMLQDESATARLGSAIGAVLRAGDVVALDGALGAGKTRLVRAIAAAVGADESLVHSPTYVLANEYPIAGGDGATALKGLVHVDAYRLDEDGETGDVFDVELAGERGVAVVIEWAERLMGRREGVVGGAWVRVELSHAGASARRATVSGSGRDAVVSKFVELGGEMGRGGGMGEDGAGVGGVGGGGGVCRVCGAGIGSDGGEDGGRGGAGAFCSARCQMVDLGRWLDGDYRISREIKDADLDTTD